MTSLERNRCVQYLLDLVSLLVIVKFNRNMFVKCQNRILIGNLFSRQFLAFSAKQNALRQSLSTTSLSANQYDDLYADRWAKFQCEIFYARHFNMFEVKIDISLLFVNCVRRSLFNSTWLFFLRIATLREFHTLCTQNNRAVICLFIVSFLFLILSKKAASQCKRQRRLRS